MEFKKFSEYNQNEKEELLMHWWYYYGKMLITGEENERFNEMIKNDSELIKDVALVSYVFGYSSEPLIGAMRTNTLDSYFTEIRNYVMSDEYQRIVEETEKSFFEQVVETYNKPEPSVRMSDEKFIESLKAIVGMDCGDYTVVNVSVVYKEKNLDSEPVLTADRVRELYSDCTLRENEIENEEPIVDFVLGEGVNSVSVFSAERIEKIKRQLLCYLTN